MRLSFTSLEGLLSVVTIGLGIYWFRNPGSNIEPVLAIGAGVAMLFDWMRRRPLRKTSETLRPIQHSEDPKPETKDEPRTADYLVAGTGSRALFAQRFGYAFPGIREVTWYEGRRALDRLSTLLASPLTYGPGAGRGPPFWWWRGGNLYIESFQRTGDDTALMNFDELKLRRVAAVPHNDYRRCWVYVETEAMPATGLYEPLGEDGLKERIDVFGYAWEEYALFRGQKIRREEYDDGAATIAGDVVRLKGEATLRIRYLTPYNFVIAPIASQFNNNHFDGELKRLLNGLLQGGTSFEHLIDRVEQLPLPSRFQDH